LREDELKKIAEAVRQVELKTSGELVPMVVRKSSTVGHVPILLLFLFTTLFFAFELHHLQQEWLDLPLWLWVPIDVILLVMPVRLLAPLPFVERWLTPRADQLEQVEQRAIIEFYNHRVHHTRHATGILVFVSLMERQAVVLGDDLISKKLNKEEWQRVIDQLLDGVRTKNLAEGFIEGLRLSGELLSQHFPATSDDTNQLKNQLIIKE
jgi:putative membrane protein